MNDDQQIYRSFSDLLFSDLEKSPAYWQERPLLAHYTSIPVIEAILRNDEIWFSNPLFMNDMDEVHFGFNEGMRLFLESEEIERACTKSSLKKLKENFGFYCADFRNNHVFDTYVFCLSQHTKGNTDGTLSMWRGYGGNGSGAAIVFDSAKMKPNETSPLIMAKVDYQTNEARIEWLKQCIRQFAAILASTLRFFQSIRASMRSRNGVQFI
jgi:hypothetical protein